MMGSDMEVRTTWSYTLILSKEEFLLVSKALRGALKESEKNPAAQLQEKMVEMKHAVLQQALEESSKTMENIQNKFATTKE
jgi:hypothetical protein